MSTSTPTVNATTSLLERAAALGITLSVHDGLVVADVPETAEATALLAQLAASKAAILATLTASQNSQNTPADWPNVDPRLMVASPAAQSRALALAEGCGWPAISLWGEPLGPGAERWQAVVAGLNTLAIGALCGVLTRRLHGVPDGVTLSEFLADDTAGDAMEEWTL